MTTVPLQKLTYKLTKHGDIYNNTTMTEKYARLRMINFRTLKMSYFNMFWTFRTFCKHPNVAKQFITACILSLKTKL